MIEVNCDIGSPQVFPAQSASHKLKTLEKKISKINSLVIFPTEMTVFHYISVAMFSSLQVCFSLTYSHTYSLIHLFIHPNRNYI